MLYLKNKERILENFLCVDCKILAFEVTKIPFMALQEPKQLHFTRSHLNMNNVQNGRYSLDSFFKASCVYA